MKIQGGCYCGNIRYIAEGEPEASIQCHCRECQYITGGNPNVIMIMPINGFKFLKDEPQTFKRKDLENIAKEIKVHFSIEWKWAFRYLWIMKKDSIN